MYLVRASICVCLHGRLINSAAIIIPTVNCLHIILHLSYLLILGRLSVSEKDIVWSISPTGAGAIKATKQHQDDHGLDKRDKHICPGQGNPTVEDRRNLD